MSVRDAQECAIKVFEMHLEAAWKICYPNEDEPTAKNIYHPSGSDTKIGRPHFTRVGESKVTGNCSPLCWRSFVRDWQKVLDQTLKDIESLAMGRHKATATKKVRSRNVRGS